MIGKMDRRKALLIAQICVRDYNDLRYSLEHRIGSGKTAKHYMNKYDISEDEVKGKKGKNWLFMS